LLKILIGTFDPLVYYFLSVYISECIFALFCCYWLSCHALKPFTDFEFIAVIFNENFIITIFTVYHFTVNPLMSQNSHVPQIVTHHAS